MSEEAKINVNKCPYCYRNIGVWNKDPIVLPYGSRNIWEDEYTLIKEPYLSKRFHIGMYQIGYEVKEIQDYLKNLEAETIPEEQRTEFTPMNVSGYFQIKGVHIKEMRESIEKLLQLSGQSLESFFNYDEGGNLIVRPEGTQTNWTDDVTDDADWDKFQIKGIHIEELRHFIAVNDAMAFFYKPIITTIEATWNREGTIITIHESTHGLSTGEWIKVIDSSDTDALPYYGNYQITKIDDDNFSVVGQNGGAESGTCSYTLESWFLYKFLDKDEYQEIKRLGQMPAIGNAWSISMAMDTAYLYRTAPFAQRIYKDRKSDGIIVDTRGFAPYYIHDIAVDGNYIWAVASKDYITLSSYMYILRINKNNMASWEIWKNEMHAAYEHYLVCDKDYLYIFSWATRNPQEGNILYKIKKEDKSIVIEKKLTTSPLPKDIAPESSIGIDGDYIYLRKIGQLGIDGEGHYYVIEDGGVIKLTKSFTYVSSFEVAGSAIAGGYIVAGKNNLYLLDSIFGGVTYPEVEEGKLLCCDKSGYFKWSTPAAAPKTPHNIGSPLATVAEYQITLLSS